jgi:hypothetical protein
MTNTHPTVEVTHHGLTANIDENIADLILDCWKLGLWTNNSCQDNVEHCIWICFDGERSAARFVEYVSQANKKLAMEFRALIDNDWWFDALYDPFAHQFDISVRFPPKNLAIVKKAIKQARIKSRCDEDEEFGD